MYFKHSLLTWALSQKSIYSAFFLTSKDALFLIYADNSVWNAVERFDNGDDNCDNNVGGDISIDDGVDTRACNAASGVTTSVTTGNPAAAVPRGKQSLGDGSFSSDLPLTSLRLAAVLAMIFWFELMLFRSIFFLFMWWVTICVVWVFVMCEYYLIKNDVAKVLQATHVY